MNYKNVTLTAVCLAFATVSNGTVGWTQQRTRPTAERRLRPGRGFWAHQRTARNIRHARDYSRSLYNYACDAENVDPKVAKSESIQLGKNINVTKNEVATAVETAKWDLANVASLKAIEKHLDAAAKAQSALHKECCKDAINGTVCAKHCSTITKELEKAQAEHRNLVRAQEIRARRHAGRKNSIDKKRRSKPPADNSHDAVCSPATERQDAPSSSGAYELRFSDGGAWWVCRGIVCGRRFEKPFRR